MEGGESGIVSLNVECGGHAALSEQMIRKQIYLEPRQVEMLKRLARERGVSQSQIVREAIDHMEMESQRKRDLEARRGWTRDSLYEERLSRWIKS